MEGKKKMTRKAPTTEVIKKLCVLSKNKCAFPGCDHPIIKENGIYIAQLCHIEAAEKGGERYNENQTDEERRSFSNLMFLCHAHHKETNDVEKYTVEVLKEMKQKHEALPNVVFNSELLNNKVQQVLDQQEEIRNILEGFLESNVSNNYPIFGPDVKDAWTPENGRFYTSNDSKIKYMMKDGWLHIAFTRADGSVFYFEVDQDGTVRNSQTPYPINEYSVKIPANLILNSERIPLPNGDYNIKTNLKWSKGSVIQYFRKDGVFMGVDCHARCRIEHDTRTIQILDNEI